MNKIIAILLITLLFITACSNSQLTGNTVVSTCTSLEGLAKDNCFFELKQCSQIKKESLRDSCVAELGIVKLDLEVCNLITSNSAKGYCQFGIAKEINDVQICESIQDRYWKDNCHYEYATANDQGVYCAAISSIEQLRDCFYETATTYNHPELCENMPSNRKEECIFKIAQNTKNIQLCKQISSLGSRSTCQLKLASKILMDESLCDTINIKDAREICHERFKESK